MEFSSSVSADGHDELIADLAETDRFEFREPCNTRTIIVDKVVLRLDRGIFTLKGTVVASNGRNPPKFWYDKSFVDSLLPDSIAMIVASEFMHHELMATTA